MAEIKIVDGAISLPDTVKNREKVKKFLKDLIDKKGLKTKSGKPSKNFKEFPKVYFGGKETEFRNKATKGDTSNKFEFANEPARTAEKNLRKQDIADANKLYSEEEVLEGQNKQKLIRKAGFEADHDIEVQEFGPARRNLDYELKSGQIDKRQFNNQLKILKDRGVGDVSKNTKQRTQSENLQKADEVLAKNKGLAQLEAKNPSRRYNQNLFIKKDRLYQQAKRTQDKFKAKEREKYSDYPEWKKGEAVIEANGVNGGNGPAKGNLLSKLKSTKAKVGGALLGGASLMPTAGAAELIQQQISEGDKLGAAKTYGKDLLVGQAASRSFAGIMKGAQSQLAKTIGPKLARQALKIAGRQLFKKGAALATGPAAPAVLTSLLIKDAYDVANVISGGKLKIRENKDMSNDERKRAVERLKFIK